MFTTSFNLNRLKEVVNTLNYSTQAVVELDYDELGRVLFKRCSGNPDFHTANNYAYDNGDLNPYNLVSIDNTPSFYQGEDQFPEVEYTSFDKITQVNQGNKTLNITYGIGHSRLVQSINNPDAGLSQIKIYVGGVFEKKIKNGLAKETHYLISPDGLFAIYSKKENASDQLVYVHKDHLGSIQSITDNTGSLLEEYSYDAWGLKRNPDIWLPFNEPQPSLTDRGYTGHEHLDLFAMVNMNGRIYDPVLGYFLSPDPLGFIPSNTQGFNPYTYVMNNPLSLVDPSGYSWLSDNWKPLVAGIAAITVSAITAGTLSPVIAGFLGGFTGGFLGSTLNGSNFKDAIAAGFQGAIIGAVSSGFAIGIGEMFGNVGKFANEIRRAFAHGAMQGTMRLAQGGRFGHGFISGAIGSLSGSIIYGAEAGAQLFVSSALGGTAESLSGGSFANGAITSAYAVLFNHALHGQSKPDDPPKDENAQPDQNDIENMSLEDRIAYYRDQGYFYATDFETQDLLMGTNGDIMFGASFGLGVTSLLVGSNPLGAFSLVWGVASWGSTKYEMNILNNYNKFGENYGVLYKDRYSICGDQMLYFTDFRYAKNGAILGTIQH